MIYLYLWLTLFACYLVAAPYLLWCDFVAVMALKRARNLGLLTKPALALGSWVLIRGYFNDLFVNVVHMTLLLGELPRELTVTSRIKRHVASGAGYRYRVCLRLRTELLDNIDPDGIHK